jgi:hypothetical protein
MIKELKKEKTELENSKDKEGNIESIPTYVEREYEFQFAWDRHATFLNAQSRAMSELRSLIRQFEEMAHIDDERRLKLEQRLGIEKTKAEVALFPQSFVDQMIGRCSVDGAKIFMNCNPGYPYHFVKTELIDKKKEKRVYYLQFNMDDNLSLSEKVKERYKRMFSSVFYQRYILGLWVMTEGLIYSMFNEKEHVVPSHLRQYKQYYISCDYGTQNPMAFGL